MLTRKTVIDQIAIKPNGVIQIRLNKTIADGDQIVTSSYHRTVIEPGTDPDAQLTVVNVHLAQMGEAPISDEEWKGVRKAVTAFHTEEAVAAYRQASNGPQPAATEAK